MIRRLIQGVGALLDGVGVRWTIGVALPIIMIAVDPAVFHSRVFGVGMPILGALKPFCYTATGMAIVTFVAWLLHPQPSAFASGAFTGAALFAGILGTAILPFSLLGILFLGLGLLGMSPFLMSAVYSRAARAAFPDSSASNRRWLLLSAGMVVVLGIPCAVQGGASHAFRHSLADITSADAGSVARGTKRLRRWAPLLDLERLVAAYTSEEDPTRRAQIAATYHELTGRDAAERAAELVD